MLLIAAPFRLAKAKARVASGAGYTAVWLCIECSNAVVPPVRQFLRRRGAEPRRVPAAARTAVGTRG